MTGRDGDTRLAHRMNDGHWMRFSPGRRVVGCHCGFRCDVESDAGYGDSFLDHFEAVVRAESAAEVERLRAENATLKVSLHVQDTNVHDISAELDAEMARADALQEQDERNLAEMAELGQLQNRYCAEYAKHAVTMTERDEAVAALHRVRALHQPEIVWLSLFSDERGPQCTHCRGDDWLCPTAAAADVPEAPK